MTLYNPPRLKYNGLTIMLSHAGRFDKRQLIDGYYGKEIESALISAGTTRYACDIRTMGCREPILPTTRVVLCCGAATLPRYFNEPLTGKLDNLRGSPFKRDEVVWIPTYHTTDAYDRQEYESRLNTGLLSQAQTASVAGEHESDEDTTETDEVSKAKGRTSRANYGFWLRADIQKAVRIAKFGPSASTLRPIILRQGLEDLLRSLDDLGQDAARLYFDIETLPGSDQISCFAIGASATRITSVSLINFRGEITYGRDGTRSILRHLAKLLSTHEFVIHNSQFDLFILGWKYKLPPSMRIADTMLMHARNYIGIEKSLGHCISLYTDLPYHKDEGVYDPKNYSQESALLTYNAKDVQTTALVYAGIREHGARLGTLTSQDQANACIRAYLGCSFRGIKLDNERLCSHLDALTKRAEFFETKVLPRLVGFNLNPRSPKQVAHYLYEMLQLPKPKGSVSPTGKTTLYKIAIEHQIPAIKVILHLRRLSKDRGTLSFQQWGEGRATCSYKIAGTKSGRLSSGVLLGRWGTNLQNINKDRCREFFISDEYAKV